MTLRARMEEKLRLNLKPNHLFIEDQSYRHAGHAELMRSGAGQQQEGTHFKVIIVSKIFEGLSRVERQRYVHDLLKEELREGIHALSLSLSAPDEK